MVTKLGKDSKYPTIEVARQGPAGIYTEEIIDWRCVTVDEETGEKIIHDEPQRDGE